MKKRVKSSLDTVNKSLDRVAENSSYIVTAAVFEFGQDATTLIDQEIVRQDIIDTGRLKRNVEADYIGKNRVVVSSEAVDPVSKRDYAPFQEYGTRHIALKTQQLCFCQYNQPRHFV